MIEVLSKGFPPWNEWSGLTRRYFNWRQIPRHHHFKLSRLDSASPQVSKNTLSSATRRSTGRKQPVVRPPQLNSIRNHRYKCNRTVTGACRSHVDGLKGLESCSPTPSFPLPPRGSKERQGSSSSVDQRKPRLRLSQRLIADGSGTSLGSPGSLPMRGELCFFGRLVALISL